MTLTDPRAIQTLTLEEKASLLSGVSFWSTRALEHHGIPALILTDGPHGVRRQKEEEDHLGLHQSLPSTCFPPAVAVGSSWNPEVARKVGEAVGKEARALGVHVVLGPGVNIKRSPLCGRNFEYYSEDPLLSGMMGAAHVEGLQSQGVGASVKHFAANNQETDRMQVSAGVDERTLREIYLPAFERVVKVARPATVMSAYNKINGVYASENLWLLTEVLRQEWGFEGLVVSDWGAVNNRVEALKAGLDLEMPGSEGKTNQEIVQAVRNGQLDEAVVDASVARMLNLTRLHQPQTGGFDEAAHHLLARELALESAVLLKNDHGTLPIQAGQSIAVIGEFAVSPRFQGGGSSHINPTRLDAPLDFLKQHAAARGQQVTFAQGFSTTGENSPALQEEALQVARAADLSVVFAGLSEKEESEGFDRETLTLPANQIELIQKVTEVSKQTVVVLSNGGVVTLEGWVDKVDAVLEGFLLGQAGGSALADLLFGVHSPSGRLAETVPVRLQDTPSFLNFPGEQGQVRYGEGVMVGYRYFETLDLKVRYPFGHGLTYTTFATRDLTVNVTGPDTAEAAVTVQNTGKVAAHQVVQLYISTTAGKVRRPMQELRGYQKVFLQPGESQTVHFTLDRRSFAHYDVLEHDWVVPAGDYTLSIGENSHQMLVSQQVTLTGDVRIQKLTLDSTVNSWFTHPLVGPVLQDIMMMGMTDEQRQQAEQNRDMLKMVGSMPMKQFLSFPGVNLPLVMLEGLIELSHQQQMPADFISTLLQRVGETMAARQMVTDTAQVAQPEPVSTVPGLRFSGKVCVVTGAASGIGRAVLIRLASEGGTVIGLDLNTDGLQESLQLAEQAARSGGRVQVKQVSISSEDEVRKAFQEVVQEHGKLDVLVNMAGILRTIPTTETTTEQFEQILKVNLTGTFLCCREALPHLERSRGNIVNAGSTSAYFGHPYMAAYSASKGGIVSMTHALSREYMLRGVRVNAIAPGGISTGMTLNPGIREDMDLRLFMHLSRPDRLFGQPGQVAGVVAMLASEDGAFLNGEIIRVDGGNHS